MKHPAANWAPLRLLVPIRWRVAKTRPEGLIALLSGARFGVERVILDPVVGGIRDREVNGSLSMSRERFLEGFLGHLLALEPESAAGSTRDG